MSLGTLMGGGLLVGLLWLWPTTPAYAWSEPAANAQNIGPYNLRILEGGVGLERPLSRGAALLSEGHAWSMCTWLRLRRVPKDSVAVALVGDGDAARVLELSEGGVALGVDGRRLSATLSLGAEQWHFVAATYDGRTARLYLDGRVLGELTVTARRVAPRLALAPVGDAGRHFGGDLVGFALSDYALSAESVAAMARARPDFSLVTFNEIGVGWPLQERAWRGLLEPQDPWTLPKSAAPADKPQTERVAARASLTAIADSRWRLTSWRMRPAPGLEADGPTLSRSDFNDENWYAAVVPGTALTTLIAGGVYPDPARGLNNMAIPETLARQDYWYRTSFATPAGAAQKFWLTFKGINYAAQVWLNGRLLGEIKGAFIRGRFEVSDWLRRDAPNTLAVRVSPPPHAGIPHEQSIMAGPGGNGGALALDGPTFIATEGWDWIPGVRDRNTGLWQEVELSQTGSLHFEDPQIVTHLPLPDTSVAELRIRVPIENSSPHPIEATLHARIESMEISRRLTLAPGLNEVLLEPKQHPELMLKAPRLWWPNGYGEPALYRLDLTLEAGGARSDAWSTRFGVREISYELSLFDRQGRLRRVEVDPAASAAPLIDVRHAAIKRTPNGWAESLSEAGEDSKAVRDIDSTSLSPYLAIRVNGVRIAARGGSWGMDDYRKRIERSRLEPYFRMQRAAHLNIVRNWLGQNTEEVFYELADEYGMLVLNDFWISTQDFQLEPEDPQLFLRNARDVIARYRNHPSIAVWFGRNEGVPPPLLNEGLAALVADLDGTRYYTGSSNRVNLQDSGPYNYRPPEEYFTALAQGFSVEVGSPSLSTLESLRASIAAPDQWPLSDSYAYHDWYFGGNGDVATFMATLDKRFGPAAGLEDFERKAQLMNYETFRAIFEGFQAHLWTRNSGRLLWMSHPAWPSNSWQLYSADYDAGAAYYAAQKACEPVHVQLNLPDHRLAVVNTTREGLSALMLESDVFSLGGRQLASRLDRLDAPANQTVSLAPLALAAHWPEEGMLLVRLRLKGRDSTLSENIYWLASDESRYRALEHLAPQRVSVQMVSSTGANDVQRMVLEVKNEGEQTAFGVKIIAVDEHGERVLPSYFSANYLTLLPHAAQRLTLECPKAGTRCRGLKIRGFNVQANSSRLD